jgi:serine/threonine protein kinase
MLDVHLHGVAHGDVEPRNVVLDDEGRVTLVDFDSADRRHACSGALNCYELKSLADALKKAEAGAQVSKHNS